MSSCLCNNPRCGSLDLFPGEHDCTECGAPDGWLSYTEPCYYCGAEWHGRRTEVMRTAEGSAMSSVMLTPEEIKGLTVDGHALYCPRGCCDE